MSTERAVVKHPDFLASAVDIAISEAVGGAGDQDVYMSSTLVHHHDGGMGQIVWNDVQAIMAKNRYVRKGRGVLVPVPEVATEGYNQHHHTSEFDGGVIVGAKPVHNHVDNAHGGFAYAVFAPATSVPFMTWEEE